MKLSFHVEKNEGDNDGRVIVRDERGATVVTLTPDDAARLGEGLILASEMAQGRTRKSPARGIGGMLLGIIGERDRRRGRG